MKIFETNRDTCLFPLLHNTTKDAQSLTECGNSMNLNLIVIIPGVLEVANDACNSFILFDTWSVKIEDVNEVFVALVEENLVVKRSVMITVGVKFSLASTLSNSTWNQIFFNQNIFLSYQLFKYLMYLMLIQGKFILRSIKLADN